MMQTVIRWRRPSEIETTRYPSSTNACSYLLRNALCYVISGTLLLVVGVIITSLTFQNLDSNPGENKERYAGPVLIAAGVLVMARGAFSRLWPIRRGEASRRRSLIRRYISEIYSRPIVALENSSTFSLCDMDMSGLYQVSSGGRLYVDEPPSYEVVTSQEFNHATLHGAAAGGGGGGGGGRGGNQNQHHHHHHHHPHHQHPQQYHYQQQQQQQQQQLQQEAHNHHHQRQHLPCIHAYSNPANNIADDEEIVIFPDGPIPIIITPVSDRGGDAILEHYDPELDPDLDPEMNSDPEPPPPSYDEYIQSEEMKTTRL